MAGLFGKLGASLTPFARNMERKLGEAYQFAGENLGFAKELTFLPEDYVLAERRIAVLRDMVEAILRANSPRAENPLVGRLTDIKRQIMEPAGSATSETASAAVVAQPRTASAYQVARACYCACDILPEEPFSVVLRKYAETEEHLGDTRLIFERESEDSIASYLRLLLSTEFEAAAQACKEVATARRRLDSLKAMTERATSRSPTEENELECAENKLIENLSYAASLMRALLENSALLAKINELVALELNYHRDCTQRLAESEKFMKEAATTHYAIYGSGGNVANAKGNSSPAPGGQGP